MRSNRDRILLCALFTFLGTQNVSLADEPKSTSIHINFEDFVAAPANCDTSGCHIHACEGYNSDPLAWKSGLRFNGDTQYMSSEGLCNLNYTWGAGSRWFNEVLSAAAEGNNALISYFSIGMDFNKLVNPDLKYVTSISFMVSAVYRNWTTGGFDYGSVRVEDPNRVITPIPVPFANKTYVTVNAPEGKYLTGLYIVASPANDQDNPIGSLILDDVRVNTGPEGSLDLSVSKISLTQKSGDEVHTDADNNPIIATVTPPTATPAPKVSPTPVSAEVTVNMAGTPAGVTSTNLQLVLDDQVIATKVVDIAGFKGGENKVTIEFTPPTDPDLLGVLPLTATINAGKAVKEENYGNNSFVRNVNTMVLCKVANAGRTVPYYSQVDIRWADDVFGIPTIPPEYFRNYGCSITDAAMIFSSYGITSTPRGSPERPFGVGIPLPGLKGESLNPGTLNRAMANYRNSVLSGRGSVGFTGRNAPNWIGAAEIARAGYRAQCTTSGACDPANAVNVVSFKRNVFKDYTDDEAIEAVQSEVCSGNPVMMRFRKASDPSKFHFMLVTGIGLDKSSNQTLILNNPGSRVDLRSEGAFYTNLKSSYPSVAGYVLFHPASDPSMMYLTAPLGVHFIVTDPFGRKTGFDPRSGVSYAEIPDASYGEESIDTPEEQGFEPSTLVAERVFVSPLDVPNGSFKVQVFSEEGGDYYLDYRSYDSQGTTNDAHYKTGTLAKGASTTVTFLHGDEKLPEPNAALQISRLLVKKSRNTGLKNSKLEFGAVIKTLSKSPVSMQSDFDFLIGGVTGYHFNIPAAQFKRKTQLNRTFYFYEGKGINIWLRDTGQMDVNIEQADLSNVDQSLLGSITVSVDSLIGSTKVNTMCHGETCSLEIRPLGGELSQKHNVIQDKR